MRYHWVIVTVLSVFVIAGVSTSANAEASSYDSEELQFLEIINEYRTNNGLQPLVLSDALTVAAGRHSEDMGEYGFFAHDTVASSYYAAGSEPWDRMAAEGYAYNTYRGENLAAGYETAEESFEAWRVSPGHNSAMLDGNYKVIGIARVYAPGSEYGWYWTTDFGAVVNPSSHATGEASSPGRSGDISPKKGAPADRGGVENGSMTDRTIWKQGASDGKNLIRDEENVARLGGYNNGRDDLRQKIRVGGDTRLVYRVRIKTQESSHPFDLMHVRLLDENGKRLAVLERYTDADAGGWRRESVDLSPYAGRTLYLSFHARTDQGLLTTFYIDDVTLSK